MTCKIVAARSSVTPAEVLYDQGGACVETVEVFLLFLAETVHYKCTVLVSEYSGNSTLHCTGLRIW